MDAEAQLLLDTGAAVNSVMEEILVGMSNQAGRRGLRADHEGLPVVQVPEWPFPEQVCGVAANVPIKPLGAALSRPRWRL